jgi:hypothetical protein
MPAENASKPTIPYGAALLDNACCSALWHLKRGCAAASCHALRPHSLTTLATPTAVMLCGGPPYKA